MLTSVFQGPCFTALRRGFATALLAMPLLACVSAYGGVGLPDYEGPLPYMEPAAAPERLEDYAVPRLISAETDLSCNSSGSRATVSLDLAPPADFRPALHATQAQIPLLITGNRALLYAGKQRHVANTHLHDGRLVLISNDSGFFNSLQSIQPGDGLLIHTAQTLRQYRVTRTRLTNMAQLDDGTESLSLLACYPFQAVGSEAIYYELRAQPLAPGFSTALDGKLQPVGTAQPEGSVINF